MAGRSENAQQVLLDFCQKEGESTKPDNHALIIEKQIDRHWSRAKGIIADFDCYGGGPEWDEENAYDELEKMTQLMINNEVSWAVRKKVLDEMLAFVASDNSGFTDSLVDIAVELCKGKEEKIYLADFLAQHGNSYYRGFASTIYRECGEDAKFLKNQKAHLEYAEDYMELADYYMKKGDEEKALETVWDGMRKGDGRLDEVYRYLFAYYRDKGDEKSLEKFYHESQKKQRDRDTILNLMYQYYKDKGDYDRQKETVIKLFSCADGEDLYRLYQNCREELTADDFAKEEKGILAVIKERKLTAYFDILMDKNETKEVIEYITRHQQYGGWGMDEGHYFSKRLAGQYPREVVEMYWNEVGVFVRIGKVENYRHAVKVLKEIRKIMRRNKWGDEWERRYGEFVRGHGRKRLLMGELEGF
ncbi:MAG: hypothetical protein K2H45_12985 [Acetatifactor sp.]|nr:hypothetical protein [Acetatifactor sp.]